MSQSPLSTIVSVARQLEHFKDEHVTTFKQALLDELCINETQLLCKFLVLMEPRLKHETIQNLHVTVNNIAKEFEYPIPRVKQYSCTQKTITTLGKDIIQLVAVFLDQKDSINAGYVCRQLHIETQTKLCVQNRRGSVPLTRDMLLGFDDNVSQEHITLDEQTADKLFPVDPSLLHRHRRGFSSNFPLSIKFESGSINDGIIDAINENETQHINHMAKTPLYDYSRISYQIFCNFFHSLQYLSVQDLSLLPCIPIDKLFDNKSNNNQCLKLFEIDLKRGESITTKYDTDDSNAVGVKDCEEIDITYIDDRLYQFATIYDEHVKRIVEQTSIATSGNTDSTDDGSIHTSDAVDIRKLEILSISGNNIPDIDYTTFFAALNGNFEKLILNKFVFTLHEQSDVEGYLSSIFHSNLKYLCIKGTQKGSGLVSSTTLPVAASFIEGRKSKDIKKNADSEDDEDDEPDEQQQQPSMSNDNKKKSDGEDDAVRLLGDEEELIPDIILSPNLETLDLFFDEPGDANVASMMRLLSLFKATYSVKNLNIEFRRNTRFCFKYENVSRSGWLQNVLFLWQFKMFPQLKTITFCFVLNKRVSYDRDTYDIFDNLIKFAQHFKRIGICQICLKWNIHSEMFEFGRFDEMKMKQLFKPNVAMNQDDENQESNVHENGVESIDNQSALFVNPFEEIDDIVCVNTDLYEESMCDIWCFMIEKHKSIATQLYLNEYQDEFNSLLVLNIKE